MSIEDASRCVEGSIELYIELYIEDVEARTQWGYTRGGGKPPFLQILRHRAPERALHELLGRGFVFRSQTVVARRRPSEVRRHSCSTLLDTLPPS